ncbi:MAG: DegT/DnrJ/EryC1/StrS family aminotransferase [Caldilineaceae bacterium]
MKIPFVDLHAQYLSIQTEIDRAIANVIGDTAFIRGKYVQHFEEEYAAAYGVKHCISCANGTDAIYIVLRMLGIGGGDEVITTAGTWIATSETITQTGARVVFVDVEDDYYCIDPTQIEAKITPRTKAIIPVHLLGQPAQIDTIADICQRHGIHLIEDTAQAHFATLHGQKVGTFGIAATFSFYPGKNLGAYGDAGAILTNDDALDEKCRIFARHGASPVSKHDHLMEGINSRLDGLQAAILSAKLPHIYDWNRARYEHAMYYNELLGDHPQIVTPKIRPNATHVFHVYEVRVPNRDQVQARLKEAGVDTSIHYPMPLPFLQAYQYLGHTPVDFPVVWKQHSEILSLPLYPEMTTTQQEYVAQKLIEALR